ncbi:ultraviolet-B receptor UVR8-like [Olea europaea var. sylvestris]|uniref:ultraviolet-B receptor UVR8-like n=1 Tax=Olea europaea var. sylvestris TaxID=158386 RepID=UPI000C1D1687|nr:ultraviolet-B receptor UVR8-like [Olea europaea var. sylvestris]
MASKTAVISWGSGEDGQLGLGNNEERERVCTITSLLSNEVSSVVAGSRNSLAICADGKLFTWGWNQRGTLGHPPETKTENIPSQVKALANVKIVQAAIGGWHCLAVDDQGQAYAWGGNEYGQCGEEPERKADTGKPVRRDIVIPQRCVPKLSVRQVIPCMVFQVDIAAGGWHSTALTDDGEVYGWGRGEHGRLGFGDDKSSKMVPQTVQLLAGEDIVQVSCGGTHSVALTKDGRMFSFGRGDHGRLGYGRKVTTGHPAEVPINLPPPVDLSGNETEGRWCAKLVACGGRHTLAIVEWRANESESLL